MKRVVFKLTPSEINSIINNLEGKKFKEIIVDFDFENEKITINEKITLKVERNSEYTYKFMKRKVKAIGGIEQLYKFIKEAAEPDGFWNNRMYAVLTRQIAARKIS